MAWVIEDWYGRLESNSGRAAHAAAIDISLVRNQNFSLLHSHLTLSRYVAVAPSRATIADGCTSICCSAVRKAVCGHMFMPRCVGVLPWCTSWIVSVRREALRSIPHHWFRLVLGWLRTAQPRNGIIFAPAVQKQRVLMFGSLHVTINFIRCVALIDTECSICAVLDNLSRTPSARMQPRARHAGLEQIVDHLI